jgi:hypothetical protein
MTFASSLKAFDIFKISHNFYLYKNKKSKGKKSYVLLYGSFIGFSLSILAFMISFGELYKLINEMLEG